MPTTLENQLALLFGPGNHRARKGADADRTAVLEARVDQLSRQHRAFRAEHERILARSLEERDARLNEQQSYLERLEREVAERTKELCEKTERIERANERMKRDLEAAAKIQKSLLPTQFPTTAGIRFAYTFQPCDELAGDSLNVFPLDDRHIGLYLLDVSGHGVPASLLSVTLSQFLVPSLEHPSLVRRHVEQPPGYEITPPAKVAFQLNQRFLTDIENEQYFTIVYGIFDVERRLFRYISAGHPGLVYAASQEASVVRTHPGFPVGWLEEADWDEHSIALDTGDRLYLYSDGVTEVMNGQGVSLGSQRLCSLIDDHRGLPLQASVAQLLDSVIEWSGGKADDDVSILALELTAQAE